jgi:hypothetical protein
MMAAVTNMYISQKKEQTCSTLVKVASSGISEIPDDNR